MKSLLFLIISFISINIYSNSDTQINLKKHISYLTSKELNGRFTKSMGSKLARNYIQNEMSTFEITSFELQKGMPTKKFPRKGVIPSFPANNLIFKLGSSSKKAKECIVFTAHYDHGSSDPKVFLPGAADNAAGVAALIEIARSFKESNKPLETEVLFTFPDMEELWVNGSPSLVEHIYSNYCNKILLNINLDVLGVPFFTGMENQLLELSGGNSESLKANLAKSNKKLGVFKNNIYLVEPFGKIWPRSDYAAFRNNNVPFVFYTSGTPWFYHTSEDTEKRIDYPLLENTVKHIYKNVFKIITNKDKIDFNYNTQENIDLNSDSKKVIEIISRYINNKTANKLTDKEVAMFKSKIKKLKDPKLTQKKVRWPILKLLLNITSKKELFLSIE